MGTRLINPIRPRVRDIWQSMSMLEVCALSNAVGQVIVGELLRAFLVFILALLMWVSHD